jgi:hypothetical protein
VLLSWKGAGPLRASVSWCKGSGLVGALCVFECVCVYVYVCVHVHVHVYVVHVGTWVCRKCMFGTCPYILIYVHPPESKWLY